MTVHRRLAIVVGMSIALAGAKALAQMPRADYDRALELRDKYEALAIGFPEPATWVPDTSRFWYRRTVSGGREFVLMDAATQLKDPAFDHARLASALSRLMNASWTPLRLPFNTFRFVRNEQAIENSTGRGPRDLHAERLHLHQSRSPDPGRRTPWCQWSRARSARTSQWMGWPLGDQYSKSSNVDNAARLQGSLLLVVGELDTNVDPASTMQVVRALLKADKVFDLLVVPGENHGAARSGAYTKYGQRKQFDFFVQHLLQITPPDWNAPARKVTTSPAQ
jgi:Prolyl oligopeptidase family